MKYRIRDFPMKGLQKGSKAFTIGDCLVIVSPPVKKLGWHMSISCKHRNFVWEEIKQAWYDLVPDADIRTGAMFFPPLEEYVNVHPHCFHIHEVKHDCKEMFG